jgi:DNA replication protein DnaC
VRSTTLAGLANELQEAKSHHELARVVGRYARIELLAVDELGYLALPEGAAELVFQMISERNERASLIVTTNLPSANGPESSPTRAWPKRSSTGSPTGAHIIETGSESRHFKHGLAQKGRRRRRPA